MSIITMITALSTCHSPWMDCLLVGAARKKWVWFPIQNLRLLVIVIVTVMLWGAENWGGESQCEPSQEMDSQQCLKGRDTEILILCHILKLHNDWCITDFCIPHATLEYLHFNIILFSLPLVSELAATTHAHEEPLHLIYA